MNVSDLSHQHLSPLITVDERHLYSTLPAVHVMMHAIAYIILT